MNEPFDKLEADLAKLKPRALSPQLVDRITEALDENPRPMNLADRCLASFMGAGGLAACVIAALLVMQAPPNNTPAMPPPAQVSMQPSSVAEFQQAMAQSSSASFELFR
jgi:hypothetical protein